MCAPCNRSGDRAPFEAVASCECGGLDGLLHIARFDAFNNAGRNATEKAGGKPHDCAGFCGRGKDKAYSRCAETARNSGNRDTEQYYAGTYDNVSDYPVVCIIIFLKFPNGGASVVAKREYIARSLENFIQFGQFETKIDVFLRVIINFLKVFL